MLYLCVATLFCDEKILSGGFPHCRLRFFGLPVRTSPGFFRVLETALFDRMFGSYEIDRRLKEMGRVSELHPYEGGVHSIHLNKDGSLNPYFTEIRDRLASFFAAVMDPDIPFFTEDKSRLEFLFINPR